MSDTNNTIKRPLSPHLQVYRLPMTAKMSITHRLTGVLLSVGVVLIALWLIAAGLGEDTYNQVMMLMDTPYTKYVFVGWAFALFYHMGNGIRHMFWDVGVGLNEKSATKTGILVILFAVGMTLAVWTVTCGCYSAHFSKTSDVPDTLNAEEVLNVSE